MIQAYSILNEVKPAKFTFKDDSSKKENIGFIAEDVPDIGSSEDHKQGKYMEIISGLTTKEVKEQQKEINESKWKFN